MRLALMLFGFACAVASGAHANEHCGSLANGVGPLDYRSGDPRLAVVENTHFDRGIETLKRAKNGTLGGEIDFVLRVFPNHHRALVAMDRLTTKLRSDPAPGANYTVACYFERAIRFRPDDGVVRMIFAFYLAKRGHPAEAIKHLEVAEKALLPNGNLHYNMGLAYVELKNYDKALEHAHRAYQLGFNLPGLRAKLERAGKWRDPPAAARAEASPEGRVAGAARTAADSPTAAVERTTTR